MSTNSTLAAVKIHGDTSFDAQVIGELVREDALSALKAKLGVSEQL